MLRWILHRLTGRFERQHRYDSTYMHEIIETSTSAALRLAVLALMNQYRGTAPASLWAGASLASTLDGDCGACAQLMLDTALKAGVPSEQLRACLNRDFEAAGDTGLGFRFAEAVLASDTIADDLRAEIQLSHGEEAVLSVAYATASGRFYPILKRALGHSSACQMLHFKDDPEERRCELHARTQ